MCRLVSGVGDDPLGLTLSSACWEACCKAWWGAGIYNLVHVVLQLADAYSWDKDRIVCEILQGRMEYTWSFKYPALLVYISYKHCYTSSLSTFPFPVSWVLDVSLDVSPWKTPNHSPHVHCCKLNYPVIHNALKLSWSSCYVKTFQPTPWAITTRTHTLLLRASPPPLLHLRSWSDPPEQRQVS